MASRHYDQTRRTERLVPAHAVRVEAEAETVPSIRGMARNLSDGGACLALDADLTVGEELIMRLLFDHYDNPVAATGRVVWTAPLRRSRGSYGIQWTHAGPQRRWFGWLARS
jgi:hypothetical protein